MIRARRLPRQKTLTLALAAALASLAQTSGASGVQTISTSVGHVSWTSGSLTITNTGTVSGGNTALTSSGASLGTLTNNGSILGGSGNQGIFNSGGTVTQITNNGTISALNQAILNTGTIGALANTGLVTVPNWFAVSNQGGSIGTLSNSGTLAGDVSGVENSGRIDLLSNSGTVTASGATSGLHAAVDNTLTGTIGTLSNAVGGSLTGTNAGINNAGLITSIINSGSIGGAASAGIINQQAGIITTLTNNTGGIISGANTGILASGNIGTITNSGHISGGHSGIDLGSATIDTLTNSGTISGGSVGIASYGGTITGLTNNAGGVIQGQTGIAIFSGMIGALSNSGTISGSRFAILNSGMLGPITNAGVIAGNIQSNSSQNLTINGGTGNTFGTLTGFTGGTIGGVGTITNTSSNVVFGAGNVLLNDNINVGPFRSVSNTGATLQVNAPMTITGNYNQSAGATLQVGVGAGAVTNGVVADTGYGRLVVSGTANIAAGSTVALTGTGGGYAFAAGQRFVVVDAAASQISIAQVAPGASTNFNEGSLHYSAGGFNGTITGRNVTTGGRSDLVLTLVAAPTPVSAPAPTPVPTPAPAPTTTPATIPNAVSALGGLANYTGINDPGLLNLFNAAQALNLGSSASANSAGTQLSPVQQASATGGAAAPTLDVLNLVSARADSLRLAKADRGTGIATGESPLDLAVWGQGFGGHANQSTRDQVDGYGATYGGLMIGADKGIGDAWRAGGVFSYSNTLVQGRDNSSGDSTRINGYGLTGYANYTGKPWYVNLSGGVVQQRYNTNREINFTGFSGIANGSFSGQQYVARAEGGYPLAVGNTTVTPLASLTYSHLNQDSYTETGGNGAALSVGATHATSLRSSVGAKLEQGFETAYGKVIPQVQLQWVHEFNHNPAVTSASFAADPSGQTAFTTVGATQVSNLADLTLGVTLLRANNLSLSARYELQLAKGFVSQTGSLRLRQQF